MKCVFNLIYKSGPHGDECTTFNIKFNGEQTLQNFLNSLSDKEWGTIYVKIPNPQTYNLAYATKDEKYMQIKIEYKYGTILTSKSEYKYLLDKLIDNDYNNLSNGGWSYMSYWLKLKM